MLAAWLSSLEAAGVCFCGTHNKFYSFMWPFAATCLVCLGLAVLGIVLFWVAHPRKLGPIPTLVFWAVIATHGIVIPAMCTRVMDRWPGGDDGGGLCFAFMCGIPVFISYNFAILTTICILIRRLLRGSPIPEIGKVVWGLIVAMATVALIVLYLLALAFLLRRWD